MKKKLKLVFILIALSLLGIIIFQSYWTINAYKVNKEKFDTDANVAMQKAMDDCKKDYFDSIRRVLIKRLSPPETIIKIDTLPQMKVVKQYATYDILFLHKNTLPGEPYRASQSQLDFYRKKISHNATLPETLTEMSFYVPTLASHIMLLLSQGDMPGPMFTMDDMQRHPDLFKFFFKEKTIPSNNKSFGSNLPPFYQHLRDSTIIAYLKRMDSSRKAKIITMPVSPMRISPLSISPKKESISAKKPDRNSQYEAGRRDAIAILQNTVFGTPHNYRQADSIRLYKYFLNELQKAQIYSPFQLTISLSSLPAAKQSLHYSETAEYEYKYHGFKIFGYGPSELFVRAKFLNPQYDVIKRMLLTLFLSLFLVLFLIFCFNYIIRTFIEQRKLGELKDDFISNMTHELKTPIATITVAIEGLQSFNALDDIEKTQRYLQTSRNELERLNNLVTKVLDIAAFENKEVKLVKEHININELVNDVIASEKLKATKKVDISFINTNNSETIYADKFHFRNVLINLVDNAVKYANEPVSIIINCYKDAGHMHIFSIKDNGIGIPAAHIGLIFDKFHRVPTGNVHTVKGTGLGLSYVKYIVEAHSGSITVKSELNNGSEFVVSIP